ncbi:TadG family pilus assembly protein [Devosia rhodophyticola]|uniref:TadG family pilus assembly protein n=1 Tax=Devosia rhodophyticola TaxID=3026423 RepID=A0ABY7Z0U3_9HYPH|nr:TadG family pilus assembly protein [Devosia rhodophyticola]WDR07141.1 TadG family pilus assembly protein [Devosia rhodophyticola]
MKLLGRFGRAEDGNMAILFAVALSISAVVSAFAVDAASLYNMRRVMQSNVDLAALAAARDPANATEIARAALAEAGLIEPDAPASAGSKSGARLSVMPGHYEADPDLPVAQRFVAGQAPLNAVQVRLERPGELYFAKSWSPTPTLGASAIARITPQVSFSIGSRLAKFQGGLVNGVLNGLLGTNVSLSLVDYKSLLDARIDAFAFLDALAQQLHISAGTYDDVLAAQADRGDIAAALAQTLDGSAQLVAQKLANGLAESDAVNVGRLFDLGDLGRLDINSGGQNLFTSFSALQMLVASASASDGSHQINLKLAANVPGLAGLSLKLAVGEPPQTGSWFAVGPRGTVVRTAQVRLALTAHLLGGGVLGNAGVNLPLYLELAHSEAMVSGASCPTPSSPRGTANIAVRPGVARLILGEVDANSFGAFASPPSIGEAQLINALLLKVTGSANVEIAQTTPQTLSFSSADIEAGRLKSVHTQTIVSSLIGSLLGDLHLKVRALGLGLASPAIIAQAIEGLISPLAPMLDLTIETLLQTLGLSLGEADVQVYGVRCIEPVLVG